MKTQTPCKVCGQVIHGQTVSEGERLYQQHLIEMHKPEWAVVCQGIRDRRDLQAQRKAIRDRVFEQTGYRLCGL